MVNKSIDFPQYRKLSNGMRFYKIISSDSFEELQLVGEIVYHFTIKAEQYPEKLRIMDMLNLTEGYLLATEPEWAKLISRLA
jgi:hypothetical protein|tara:strand:+ start:22541 stop:22786 length:246 start_codon:yes stop_codon:yes gene_type:complete